MQRNTPRNIQVFNKIFSSARKIINWKHTLQFPEDSKITQEARDLIKKLCCDANERLGKNGVDEIKAHPFFKGIDWQKIRYLSNIRQLSVNNRETSAPIIPTLKDQFDVSYFDSFDDNSDSNGGNTSGSESRDEDQEDESNGRAKNHW